MAFRIGHGVDVHPFVKGRKLIIGGVEIAYELGLEGHSDADVLLHAIIDGLLGAAGKADIGSYFPNTDARWKNASSLELLSKIWEMLKAEGYTISNLDCVVLAEEPKINPHISKMKELIAQRLALQPAQIGIKATTTERLGFVGRKEGIMASSVVLLERSA